MKLIALHRAFAWAIAISCSFLPTAFVAQSCKCPKNPGPGGGVHCASNQIATCDPTSGECNCTCDSAQQGKTKEEYEAQIFSQVLHKKVDPAELSSPQYAIPSSSFRKAPQFKGTFSFDTEEQPAGRSERPGKIRVGVPDWLEKILEGHDGVSVGPGALLQNCPNGKCTNGNNHVDATSATTHGSDSPAVGSVTQGAGSAMSINQQGGVTVGTLTVNAARDLTMSDAERQQAFDRLGRDSMLGVKVEVMITNQPTEKTFDFARQLERLLREAGAEVTENTAGIYIPVGGTAVHKGITFNLAKEYTQAADKLGKALGETGIIPCPVPTYMTQSGEIQIIVAPGSEGCN